MWPDRIETWDINQWNNKYIMPQSPTTGAIFFFGLGFCQEALLFFHVFQSATLQFLCMIWPSSGQFFEVPVQLLGDDVMPVNNSTVPLCWTCVMLTMLAQQAAYFRGCTRLQTKAFTASCLDLLFWFLLFIPIYSLFSLSSVKSAALASVICRFQTRMDWTFVYKKFSPSFIRTGLV